MRAYAILEHYDDYDSKNKYQVIETIMQDEKAPWKPVPESPIFEKEFHAELFMEGLRDAEDELEKIRRSRETNPPLDETGFSGAR